MSTIKFELRLDKIDKNGKAPLRLVYQIKGQRKFFNIDQKLYPASWDHASQKAIYLDKSTAKKLLPGVEYDRLLTSKDVTTFNDKLSKWRDDIADIETRFTLDKIQYSSEDVVNKLRSQQAPKTKKEDPSSVVYDYIDKYLTSHTNLVKGSLIVYKSLKKHLQDFEQVKRRKVTFDKINNSFFEEFQGFLINKHHFIPETKRGRHIVKSTPLYNTTIAKQLSTLKTFLNYAKKDGINVSDSHKHFKIKRENIDVIALTENEFESLFYLDLSNNKRLDQVRDIFCMACASGLRYSDIAQLKKEHIKGDEIRLTVKKTKEPIVIPLTPYSKAILAKYESLHRPLPTISNQKMNAYLKGFVDQKGVKHIGLCELAGINEQIEIVRYQGSERVAETYPKYELIGVHTGRKTFVTLSLEKGMIAEEVMSITGHKDYKSFKKYVKITEQRKKVVMLKAWGNPLKEAQLKAV